MNEVVLSLRGTASRAETPKQQPKDRPPLLTFLGDAFQAGGDFLSRPFALSILFAIALPGAILAVLLVSLRSQPTEELAVRPTISQPADVAPAVVARVTRTHECEWEPGGAPLVEGAALPSGRLPRLDKGLVEITFAQGARVILQGPATFDATNAKQGFLRAGRLVAHVTGEAAGFAVETPTAKIVDLGTEFGVCVEDQGRSADVHVFQGEVELTPAASQDRGAARRRLAAGRSLRVALAAQSEIAAVTEISSLADRFVRQMPAPESRPSVIVADFSGGNGDTGPDQFPGTAGAGWAGGWACPPAEGTRVTASVEQTNPVRDGGEYLRMSVERTSEAACGEQGIERSLESNKQVDLTKPYIVFFTVRIDALGGFVHTLRNRFALCNVGPLHDGQAVARSGWRIQFGAKDNATVKARHWYFVPGDGWGGWQTIDSGIAVREGESYSFRIVFDPIARIWTPSIAVDGGPWTTFAPVPVRSAGTAEELGYWSRLYFYWAIQKGYQDGTGTMIGFSVDSIRITAVEEK